MSDVEQTNEQWFAGLLSKVDTALADTGFVGPCTHEWRGSTIVVRKGEALAHVLTKFNPVKVPPLEQLYGSAVTQGRVPVAFSMSGFKKSSTMWAAANQVTLFNLPPALDDESGSGTVGAAVRVIH